MCVICVCNGLYWSLHIIFKWWNHSNYRLYNIGQPMRSDYFGPFENQTSLGFRSIMYSFLLSGFSSYCKNLSNKTFFKLLSNWETSHQVSFSVGACQGVAFTSSRLTVSQDTDIIAIKEKSEKRREGLIKNDFLICHFCKDVIKVEPLVSLIPGTASEGQVTQLVRWCATWRR